VVVTGIQIQIQILDQDYFAEFVEIVVGVLGKVGAGEAYHIYAPNNQLFTRTPPLRLSSSYSTSRGVKRFINWESKV
jgi:hypothetical protein